MSLTNSNSLLEREDIGDVTVIRVKAPMLQDDETTTGIFEQLYAVIDNSGRHKLVLDLKAIKYFTSSALGKLVTLHRKSQAAKTRLVLCHVTPTVQRILELTRLADVMIAYPDEREAVQSLG